MESVVTMTETSSPSNECGSCGWPIGENTRHEPEGEVCNVIDTRNERLIGWKRFKKPPRKMYKD